MNTHDIFVVIDLDRTLLKSDELLLRLCMAMTLYGVGAEDAKEDVRYIKEQTGQSFQVRKYLTDKYGETVVNSAQQELLQQADHTELKRALLYAGSRELLDTLDSLGIPFGILTYGEVENQMYKLEVFRRLVARQGTELPAAVTDEKYKGRWMHHTWYSNEDGLFHIPADFTQSDARVVKQVVVIDDKIENLRSPEPNVRGIMIDNDDSVGKQTLAQLVENLRKGQQLEELSSHYDVEPDAALNTV